MSAACPTCGKGEQGARVVTDCGFPGPHPDVWTFPTDAERAIIDRVLPDYLATQQILIATLAPLVADRERAAAARALRVAAEAAPDIADAWPEDIFEPVSEDEPDPVVRDRVAAHMARHCARVIFPHWLRARADELEAGED